MALKILFLSHKFYPDVGGIEVTSEILANAFHNAGHAVRLLTWSEDATEKTFAFEVSRNPDLSVLFQANLWADIVFENNPCLRLSWPAYFFHKPLVVALQTWVSRTDGKIKWQDKLKLRWLKRARHVIAVSDSVRRKTWPAATIIGNPYRADVFKNNSNKKRSRNFVFVGRLVSDKGVEVAIKAIHQLMTLKDRNKITNGSSFSLTIIGDGPERKKLEDFVHCVGLGNHVSFTGLLRGNSLASCLNDHNFIIVPSLWEEPFGIVALEGMACGCIPIVSDGGGLPEAVGKAGLVFERGNVNALATCILSVIDNQCLQKRLRENVSNHLAAHHPEVIAEKYLEIITATQTSKQE